MNTKLDSIFPASPVLAELAWWLTGVVEVLLVVSGRSMAAVLLVGYVMASVDEGSDPLFPPGVGFPLGRLVLPVEGTALETGSEVLVPLALRYTVAPAHVAVVDVDAVGYDEQRQIGVIHDGDALIPLFKHSTGKTRTNSARLDSEPHESDEDYTED